MGIARDIQIDPQAPSLESHAPNTMVPIWVWMHAPAHIGQGSSVTASVQSERFHEPNARAASRMAMISACASGSPSASRVLSPRPMIWPSVSTTTAPTGTSPAAAALLRELQRAVHHLVISHMPHMNECMPRGLRSPTTFSRYVPSGRVHGLPRGTRCEFGRFSHYVPRSSQSAKSIILKNGDIPTFHVLGLWDIKNVNRLMLLMGHGQVGQHEKNRQFPHRVPRKTT